MITLVFSLFLAEVFLRLKNSDMKNYDIEMWKYSNELKLPAKNPKIGHVHKKNASSTLQSVRIRTNSLGLRGNEDSINRSQRKILFLGSSITLGWGVNEESTVVAILDQMLGNDVSVLNAGVGNYNSVRYITNFLENLTTLNPDTIVVQYFVNDAEELVNNKGNFLLKNSQLAVTMWSVYNKVVTYLKPITLERYYKNVYRPDSSGFLAMQRSMDLLADYSNQFNVRVILAMTPDIHKMRPYRLKFIHDIMKVEASKRNFEYTDLFDTLSEVQNPRVLWAMLGDPHPNKLGHELMAKQLYQILK